MNRSWRRSLATLLSAAAVATAGTAVLERSLAAPTGGAPVKVVVLVVDGLHPDEVTPQNAPELAALRDSGTWYEQSRSIMVAETIPNHVAMMTGAYGARSGIPVNRFWSRNADGEPGDMESPELLKAETLFTAIDEQCPELRSAALLSKTYLHGIFSGDRDGDGQPDADVLWEPSPVIPESDHAPDMFTTDEVLAEIPNEPDLMFVNLGDVDRSGHVDPTGVIAPAIRTAVLRDTDAQVGRIVDALEARGTWDDTVMFLVSDHSMDWSAPLDYISLDEALSADERTAGNYTIVHNGGVDNVYVNPGVAGARRVRAAVYEIASGVEGVERVLYTKRNPADPAGDVVPRPWGLRTRRAGDVIALAEPGRRFSDPSPGDNPIPGNHGHPITRHNVVLVTGGAPIVRAQSISPSDPGAVDPFDDTGGLPEQSENVDIGVTVAWLLGISDPGTARPQFQGRVLTEAFTARPRPSC